MLSAKLHTPAINKSVIKRDKLLDKLRHTTEHKLTLITAPAGYGKTTAILNWIEECGLPSAWLSLDPKDNESGVFWQYFCSSLDGIAPGLAKDTEYVFSHREMIKANMHVSIIIDRLKKIERDFVMVLDDLHYITDPDIMDGLSYLIDYIPQKMHLVFIGRSAPDFGVARHKLKWQIRLLDEKDLRFAEDEIFLFYKARGTILDENDIIKIKSYSEGWVAALVAVAMSIEDGGERDVIAALDASSKDIGQYLDDEVLKTWNIEKRDFALKACVLDTLSPDICDAITGVNNGQKILSEIYEGNGFLIALDSQKQHYRYHNLFKRLLQKILAKTAPQEIAVLHTRAGFWFRERKMVPEALEHFLEGGQYAEALELIENHIDNHIRKNDFGRVVSWVERLPKAYRDKSFKIAAIYTMYYAETGSFSLSRTWLEKAKTLREERILTAGSEWTENSHTICTLAEANLLMREGDIKFAQLVFMSENKPRKISGYTDFNTSDIYFYRSPINVFARLLKESPDQYAKMISSYRGMISNNPGYAPLAVGAYYYENDSLEQALPCLLKALEEARCARCPGALTPAMVDIARIRRAKGDMEGALETLGECESILRDMGKAYWIYGVRAFRCRLHIEAENTAAVEEWLASCKLNEFTELCKVREFELLVYCRALIFKGKYGGAKLLLQRMLAFAQETVRLHSEVEILNLLALLEFRENDMSGAAHRLELALEIGEKEGYIRSFLDEGAPMAGLLKYYVTQKSVCTVALSAYAKNLLERINKSIPTASKPLDLTSAGILLTPQEKKVLGLLLKAYSNQEISEKLCIGVRTVKTHTGNIYGKLGVENRTQCICLLKTGQRPKTED